MGIEDIQISEELETNAPSIKYSGNEGPKSPQEMQQMMMASLEEEYAKYVFEMQEQGLEPMSLRQFIDQAMAEGQMSGGNPLPQDPTKPVNPFQPKPTGPVLPDRQMAAYGGIMGVDGRRQYGIGSSLKKRIRKLIPNEVAKVAEVAAPFVAPFNPLAAGLMKGVGGFDRTGSIGDSLKSGLMTYGLGQGARYLGGADFQGMPEFLGGQGIGPNYGFSMPTGSGGIKNLFKSKTPVDGTMTKADLISGADANTSGITSRGGEITADSMLTEPSKVLNTTKERLNLLDKFKQLPGQIKNTVQKAGISPTAMMGILGASAAAGLYTGMTQEDEVLSGLDRGKGMDIAGIRAEVTEAMKDPSGELLKALRVKYPFLGTQASKNTADMAMGGRIGRAEGGLMDLGGMEKDYRAEGGFVPIGAKEKADDVPARLSVNEFVFTADAVRNAGGGDIDKGAEVMENMMKNLEAGGQVSQESQGIQGLRAGGRAGFANGLTVDTDKVIEDIKKFSIPGLIGRGVKAGADKISDIELESIIKVIAKATPGGMVMEKVTEFLVNRYGMTEDEAQMRIVNKLGTDANEGFKQPSGTSDEGYRMVGIESSAEDTSDIPIRNRLRNILDKVPSIEMPELKPPFNFDDVKPVPMPGSEKPPLSPDATNLNPHQDINPLQTMEFRDMNGNGIEDRAEGIYRNRDLIPYDPNREFRNLDLEKMFDTSERLSEVVG